MISKQFPLLIALFSLSHILPAQKKEISLDDLFKKDIFSEADVQGFRSMKDGQHYTQIQNGDLVEKDFASGEKTLVLVRGESLRDKDGKLIPLDDYTLSDDESRLLINTDITHRYRNSYTAIVYIYEIASKKLTKVSNQPIMNATFSPDGSKVAYDLGNDLYIFNLETGRQLQVTRDGEENAIINGSCDWVYEEEFEFVRAFQWSPIGDCLAYYRFDESMVRSYSFPVYGPGNYPSFYTYKYPKAGEDNSQVAIHVFRLTDSSNTLMDTGPIADQYIPRIKWTTYDDTLCIYRLNRLQNRLDLLLDNTRTGESRLLYTEQDPWYVDESLFNDCWFLKDSTHFVIMTEQDGYQHLWLHRMDGSQETLLTPGHYDVDQVAGLDEPRQFLYYTAATPDPMERQLFMASLRGGQPRQISSQKGWHVVEFSADCSYFLDGYSTIDHPTVTTLCDRNGHALRVLEDNDALNKVLKDYSLGPVKFLKIPDQSGDSLNAWMLLPADFNPGKKYPVLFMNYGGPGSQTVADSWGIVDFWQQMLAEKGYIIFSMDNRGTGFRGAAFKKETYLRLGEMEIADQIQAARWLDNLPYVDQNRIGHWGWSFGGFMSCQAITHGAKYFHMAIAIAPVTDWRFYDNIYTERYMRTPAQNPDGYKETSPINYVDLIKGKFLIIQGTADDNVHFQNSVMMVNAMIDHDIPFQSAYYPNKNHGIYGGNTTLHLYSLMTRFILDNL